MKERLDSENTKKRRSERAQELRRGVTLLPVASKVMGESSSREYKMQ